MAEIIERWRAGCCDWNPLPLYELILEAAPPKWRLTYLVQGERHARIGFDTEEEARRDLAWLKTHCPASGEAWTLVTIPAQRGAPPGSRVEVGRGDRAPTR